MTTDPLSRVGDRSGRSDPPLFLGRAALGFGLLAILLFGDYLFFASDGQIASSFVGDVARYFSYVRAFAAAELAAGNIPLWNPHSFSGNPFVGVFQTAVFYPPILIYLVLPLDRALNADLASSVCVLGVSTYVWLRGHRLHGLACFVGAAVVVLGAPFFLRVLAGQLSVLGTVVWWPLVLASIDRLASSRSAGWLLLGIAAVTLMLLAGHPPTALMCALMTAAYTIFKLWSCSERGAFVLEALALAVAPLLLSAAQLWTGLDVAGQGIRSEGVDIAFATSFSLPPENLLTLVAPEIAGTGSKYTYFGRWFYWDASIYLGAAGLALAIHGARVGPAPLRRLWLGLALIGLVLALGRYTPIYGLVYHGLPGFDLLRSPSKFAFHASLFAAGLAALGVDGLLRDRSQARRSAAVAAALALIVALLAIWVWAVPPDGAGAASLVERLAAAAGQTSGPGMLAAWQRILLATLPIQLLWFAVTAALLALAPRRSWAVPLLLALALLDLAAFAHRNRGGTHLLARSLRHDALVRVLLEAGHDRVLFKGRTGNLALALRAHGLWGYEPITLDRYTRFMASTQGRSVADLNNIGGDPPDRFHPLLRMLRGRFSVTAGGDVTEHAGAWPRFRWMTSYRVVPGLDAALDALADPDLDLERELVLEAPPEVEPEPEPGVARLQLVGESTDRLELEVRLAAPAILVVTDSWARGWRAWSVTDGERFDHAVVPANAVLRAIALPAGSRRLTLEYSPAVWRPAVVASSVSGSVYLALVGWWCVSSLRARRAVAATPSVSGR